MPHRPGSVLGRFTPLSRRLFWGEFKPLRSSFCFRLEAGIRQFRQCLVCYLLDIKCSGDAALDQADFISTGYYGLQTGILGITAVFTLVFAYLWALHVFLRDEPILTRIAMYIVFFGAFVFLHLFLYSASLFGQEWMEARKLSATSSGEGIQGFYASNSVIIMRIVWSVIALATLVFATVETFRSKRP